MNKSAVYFAIIIAILLCAGCNANPEPEIKSVSPEDTVWQEKGVAVSGAYADADIIDLGDGQYRLYYSEEPETPGFSGRVYSALSTDGVTWTNEPGIRKEWAIFPSVIKLPDGQYRMYFQRQEVIQSAISSDGLNWADESGIRIDKENSAGLTLQNVAAPTVAYTNGEYLMIYRGTMDGKYSSQVPNRDTELLLWATSTDGLIFEKKGIAVDSRNDDFNGLLDGPELFTADNGQLQLYFWSYGGVFHRNYANGSFVGTNYFDYTTDSRTPFPENPPCDPTLIKIGEKMFMYYGQHTRGIYYASK